MSFRIKHILCPSVITENQNRCITYLRIMSLFTWSQLLQKIVELKPFITPCTKCSCMWVITFQRATSLHKSTKELKCRNNSCFWVCNGVQANWKLHYLRPRLSSVERLVVKYAYKSVPGTTTYSAARDIFESKPCAIVNTFQSPSNLLQRNRSQHSKSKPEQHEQPSTYSTKKEYINMHKKESTTVVVAKSITYTTTIRTILHPSNLSPSSNLTRRSDSEVQGAF